MHSYVLFIFQRFPLPSSAGISPGFVYSEPWIADFASLAASPISFYISCDCDCIHFGRRLISIAALWEKQSTPPFSDRQLDMLAVPLFALFTLFLWCCVVRCRRTASAKLNFSILLSYSFLRRTNKKLEGTKSTRSVTWWWFSNISESLHQHALLRLHSSSSGSLYWRYSRKCVKATDTQIAVSRVWFFVPNFNSKSLYTKQIQR